MTGHTTLEQQLSAAILAVVATMEDCEKEGIPAVASSIYLALESRGFRASVIIRMMDEAGIIKDCGSTLERGPHFEEVAAAARSITEEKE